jgi:hypothetical protein
MSTPSTQQSKELEYKELLVSYRNYFDLASKGITIYLAIIGACLTLPFTLRFDSTQSLELFREMCRVFAFVASIGGIAAYATSAVVFGKLHMRQVELANEIGIKPQATWLLQTIVWISIGVAALLLVLLVRHT